MATYTDSALLSTSLKLCQEAVFSCILAKCDGLEHNERTDGTVERRIMTKKRFAKVSVEHLILFVPRENN